MLFNSTSFAFFFVIVTSLYFAIPHKFRWLLLLLSSCYFYMTFVPVYILILVFTIVIDYFAGILIEAAQGKKRRWFLTLSLVANISVLAIFKYYNFFNINLSILFTHAGFSNPLPYLTILLPIGLSFHTFQAMSYTIEIYRGNQKAERHFGIYALYVMFYPQLIAGPIERPQNLLHQFYEKHTVDYNRMTSGLRLMAWGLFKKVVIADRLSILVDYVYNDPYHHRGLSFIIAAVCFSFQIYCDFSGYTNIAVGAARVMGFTLMNNFNFPFISKSVTEFWRRWHISLSTWFNDYLFTPIAINKRSWGNWAIVYAIFVTFFISGLWHGAGWNFIIWGLFHGLAASYEFLTKNFRKKLSKTIPATFYDPLSNLLVFSFLSFTWIFFRVPSFKVTCYIIKCIATQTFADLRDLFNPAFHLQLGLIRHEVCVALAALAVLQVVHVIQRKGNITQLFKNQPVYIRWAVYYAFLFILIIYSVSDNKQFIYFQF